MSFTNAQNKIKLGSNLFDKYKNLVFSIYEHYLSQLSSMDASSIQCGAFQHRARLANIQLDLFCKR